jgi:alkylated DNA nucleotide flippase Atl1
MTAVGQTRSFGDVGSVSGLPEADMVGGVMSTRPRSFDSEFASECA